MKSFLTICRTEWWFSANFLTQNIILSQNKLTLRDWNITQKTILFIDYYTNKNLFTLLLITFTCIVLLERRTLFKSMYCFAQQESEYSCFLCAHLAHMPVRRIKAQITTTNNKRPPAHCTHTARRIFRRRVGVLGRVAHVCNQIAAAFPERLIAIIIFVCVRARPYSLCGWLQQPKGLRRSRLLT